MNESGINETNALMNFIEIIDNSYYKLYKILILYIQI